MLCHINSITLIRFDFFFIVFFLLLGFIQLANNDYHRATCVTNVVDYM